jgi:hypothetical protein
LSGHERERLSAYLDGELSLDERAAVEAHLAACGECTGFLARLSGADDAASALPVEPPEGYFDSFAGRVRARLEGRREATSRSRVPAWTWAAAAALLLAVVTPLTLRHARPVVDEAAPVLEGARPTAPDAGPRAKADRDVASGAPEPRPEAPESAARAAPAQPTPPAAPRRSRAQAPTPAAAPPQAYQEAKDEAADSFFAREPPAPQARDEAAPRQDSPGEAEEQVAGGGAPEDASHAKTSRVAPDAAVTAEAASPLLSAASTKREARAARIEREEDAFRRLEAQRPSSAAGWRRLREQWSALAISEADPVRADDARVRAIAAAREAWWASGDSTDEAVFRAGAESYLRRQDARQKPHVELLLSGAEPRSVP